MDDNRFAQDIQRFADELRMGEKAEATIEKYVREAERLCDFLAGGRADEGGDARLQAEAVRQGRNIADG